MKIFRSKPKLEKDIFFDEIQARMKELETMDVSSEEYTDAVENIRTLCNMYLERYKCDSEDWHKDIADIMKAMAFGATASISLYIGIKGIKMEETGVFQSSIFKGFVQKIFDPKFLKV